MDWLEASVTVDHEAVEAVAEVLSRYAHQGVAIEAGPEGVLTGSVVVRAYLPVDDQLLATKRRVEEALWHLCQIWPVPPPVFRPLADADWAEAWKTQLRVLRVGQHIVVKPSWLECEPQPGDVVIQLDPGMAFGTGLHPTTQMCLAALERLIRPGMEVLDVGTGSGILAIAAARLGAGRVLAVDHDAAAVHTARGNVIANGLDGVVQVVSGSLGETAGVYDLVLVNILARVIVEMVQQGLGTRLRPRGKLIAAGILDSQAPEVLAALEQAGFALVEQRQDGDWVGLVAESSYSSSSC